LKRLNGTETKALFILSIVAPVGLLAAFRLTGILEEPITISESIRLDAVERRLERPSAMIDIHEMIPISFMHDGLCLNITILVDEYIDKFLDYGGADFLDIIVTLNASTLKGHIESIDFAFSDDYERAQIDVVPFDIGPQIQNLSIRDLKSMAREAFMNLTGVNCPKSVNLWTPISWILRSPYSQAHLLKVVFKLVYFNGTAYREIVQPFQLGLSPDSNNSFEEAVEVFEGRYLKLFIGGEDPKDFYKIYATQGEKIRISVDSASWSSLKPYLGLCIYDSEGIPRVRSREWISFFETIDFVANSTGFWFIEVRILSHWGYYSMEINR